MRARVLLLVPLLIAGARADDAAPTPEAIERAIGAGVKWLKSAQREDGSWGPCEAARAYGGGTGGTCYTLGPTAFSVFALAVCGVPRRDRAVERGLHLLSEADFHEPTYSSYESAAVILMLTALNDTSPPPKGRPLVRTAEPRKPPEGSTFPGVEWRWMDDRVRHLVDCQASGGFAYWSRQRYADVSATQFAILALRAASLAGYPVERVRPDVWTRAAEYLRGVQQASGGFPYQASGAPTQGMTAAALSSLLICREQIAFAGDPEPPWMKEAIAKGLAYLDANFDVTSNPSEEYDGRSAYHYCHLYAIERTGMLSGRRELGGKSWYGRGAAYLLARQQPTGRWNDDTCMRPSDVLGTAFALLFLKKATIPAITAPGR